MVGKGLLGQYAGFISRAVGFVLDILIVIGLIWVVNFAITLPLQYFLGFDIKECSIQSPRLLQIVADQRQLFCFAVITTQTLLTLIAGPAYFILFWVMGGQTIGQYIGGVRVVRVDGRKMNFRYSLVRYLGYFVSFFALGLGYLWVLWDDRRQGFQDKLAKTVVVYAWQARQNELLLDRVRARLRMRPKHGGPALTEDELLKLRYVVVDFKLHSEMNGALSSLEELVRRCDLDVVNVIVLVKDEEGSLGLVGISDFSLSGSATTPLIASLDMQALKSGLQLLLQHYPNESFIVAVLVRREMVRRLADELEHLHIGYDVLDMKTVLGVIRDPETAEKTKENPPEG